MSLDTYAQEFVGQMRPSAVMASVEVTARKLHTHRCKFVAHHAHTLMGRRMTPAGLMVELMFVTHPALSITQPCRKYRRLPAKYHLLRCYTSRMPASPDRERMTGNQMFGHPLRPTRASSEQPCGSHRRRFISAYRPCMV